MFKSFFKLLNKEKGSKLCCFTPEVMVATFVVESLMALYVFVRYKISKFVFLNIIILILLAVFQLAEFFICRGSNEFFWLKSGFVSITFLPIVGLHLMTTIYKEDTNILRLGYLASIFITAFFIFLPKSLIDPICGGNYIIFYTTSKLRWFYTFYYFSILVFGIFYAWEGIMDKNIKI
ncbi:hypothetical protein ACFLY7_01820, partial [Patescibacteria group bacterium]